MDDALIHKKKLIEYLPDFMAQFREMQEIMQSEDVEFENLDKNVQYILNNAFIETCDEYGIKKYESLLGIIPADNESLETRKMRVLIRWSNYSHYTVRVLVSKLNLICGVNNYDLELDLENDHFKVITELGTYGSVDELIDMFESILPMNIFYELVNTLNIESECLLNYGGGSCISSIMTFTEDYIDKGVIAGDAYVTGTVVFSSKELITNDFKETVAINGEAKIAAGTVQAQFFEIKS